MYQVHVDGRPLFNSSMDWNQASSLMGELVAASIYDTLFGGLPPRNVELVRIS